MTSDERPYAGETISYASTETALGVALVAESVRGIAAILIGDDHARLVRALRDALPGALLAEDEASVRPSAEAVAALIAEPGNRAAAGARPARLAARAGVVGRVARGACGRNHYLWHDRQGPTLPATAQDVGAACAANRVAVAAACHRLVKADGSISGHRWGVQRKRRLINLEGVA